MAWMKLLTYASAGVVGVELAICGVLDALAPSRLHHFQFLPARALADHAAAFAIRAAFGQFEGVRYFGCVGYPSHVSTLQSLHYHLPYRLRVLPLILIHKNFRNVSSVSPTCRIIRLRRERFTSPGCIGTEVMSFFSACHKYKWLPRCPSSTNPARLSACTTLRGLIFGSLLMSARERLLALRTCRRESSFPPSESARHA